MPFTIPDARYRVQHQIPVTGGALTVNARGDVLDVIEPLHRLLDQGHERDDLVRRLDKAAHRHAPVEPGGKQGGAPQMGHQFGLSISARLNG